jgi:hypothetical protein
MQTIFQTSLTPEQYAEQEYHKQVKAPENWGAGQTRWENRLD